jgi:hypothetical protein
MHRSRRLTVSWAALSLRRPSLARTISARSAAHIAVATARFSRPADTLAYASAMRSSTAPRPPPSMPTRPVGTAGIMRLHVARATDKTGMIRRLRLKTNDTAFAGATVRVHLYRDRPTVTNGDNGAFLTTESNYIGYSDVVLDRHFSDAEKGIGVPAIGSEWNFEPAPAPTTSTPSSKPAPRSPRPAPPRRGRWPPKRTRTEDRHDRLSNYDCRPAHGRGYHRTQAVRPRRCSVLTPQTTSGCHRRPTL